jgi:hypothetical protein
MILDPFGLDFVVVVVVSGLLLEKNVEAAECALFANRNRCVSPLFSLSAALSCSWRPTLSLSAFAHVSFPVRSVALSQQKKNKLNLNSKGIIYMIVLSQKIKKNKIFEFFRS